MTVTDHDLFWIESLAKVCPFRYVLKKEKNIYADWIEERYQVQWRNEEWNHNKGNGRSGSEEGRYALTPPPKGLAYQCCSIL